MILPLSLLRPTAGEAPNASVPKSKLLFIGRGLKRDASPLGICCNNQQDCESANCLQTSTHVRLRLCRQVADSAGRAIFAERGPS